MARGTTAAIRHPEPRRQPRTGIQTRESPGRSDLGLQVCRSGYRTRNGLRGVWLGLDVECCSAFAVQVNGEAVRHQRESKKVHELTSVTK